MRLLLARFAGCLVGLALSACGLLPETAVPPGGLLPETPVPPEHCGFPENAPLVFAGRSTTGALDVHEGLGDPLASHPADIYITRDAIDGPAGRGQTVCMILVDQPTFLEVTLVPEGWNLENGRPPAESPTAKPEPAPQPEQGLGKAEAIAAARAAVPHVDDWKASAFYGPATDVLLGMNLEPWAQAIPTDHWLWVVTFDSGLSTGTMVYLDYEDGTIYHFFDWIS